MSRLFGNCALIISLVCCTARAQTAGTRITADPGVVAVRLIDRPEVRVSRIELRPGAIRRVHSHADVQFHLFIGIQGTVMLTIGSEKPIEVKAGVPYFLKAGTPHGFMNAGSMPAVAMEIFVKTANPPIAYNSAAVLASALQAMADKHLFPIAR